MASEEFSKFIKQIWPQERDFLERPDRWKYVRKIVEASDCVFCQAEKSNLGFESLCLFKTEHSMVIVNKYPYNSGHLMVLPRRHTGDLIGLSEVEYRETSDLIRMCISVLKAEYQPAGFNIGLNHGAVAGAGIPEHLHWHIIPRWAGDTNFFPLIAETKVLPETLRQTFDRLFARFKDIKG